MARGNKRYTIFDMMAERGVFEDNPANTCSPEYVKAEYPKMFYHPQGEFRVTVQAECIVTPMGPKLVGEQRELIWQIAKDETEAKKLIAAGWHDHPGKAMGAAGLEPPPESAQDELTRVKAELAAFKAAAAAPVLAPTGTGPMLKKA